MRRITSILVLVTMLSLASCPTFAAKNVCSVIKGNSKCGSSVSFRVDTGKRIGSEYIKLSQSKGIIKYMPPILPNKPYPKMKTKNQYGHYEVIVKNLKTKKEEKHDFWKKGSMKIKFKKTNCSYKVTIKAAEYMANYSTGKDGAKSWTKYANWSVTKTKGIKMCR